MGENKGLEKSESDVILILTVASTGLKTSDFNPEICQLTLIKPDGQKLFSKYVLPAGHFQKDASSFNGFTVEESVDGKRRLMRHAKEVKACALEKVANDFLLEISSIRAQVSGRIVLVGYFNKMFDMPLVMEEFSKCGITLRDRFCKMNVVCADLYQLLMLNRNRLLPGHSGDLKMTTVFNVLHKTQHAHKHDSVEDADKLRAIYEKLKGLVDKKTFERCIFSVSQLEEVPGVRQPQMVYRNSVKRQNDESDTFESEGRSAMKKRRT